MESVSLPAAFQNRTDRLNGANSKMGISKPMFLALAPARRIHCSLVSLISSHLTFFTSRRIFDNEAYGEVRCSKILTYHTSVKTVFRPISTKTGCAHALWCRSKTNREKYLWRAGVPRTQDDVRCSSPRVSAVSEMLDAFSLRSAPS
jgi:hypothetical protein